MSQDPYYDSRSAMQGHKLAPVPRTTTWQILRLAWALWRSPSRKWLRISQFVGNCTGSYYIENDTLITLIQEMNRE